MTAPEREALRNELRQCHAALSDIISCNDERGDDAVPTWVATMLRGVRATIRDALQALSAPAVTVTPLRLQEIAGSPSWIDHNGQEYWNWQKVREAMQRIASEAALKSTTPQTGSQE